MILGILNLLTSLYLIYISLSSKCNPPMSIGLLLLGLGLFSEVFVNIDFLKQFHTMFYNEYFLKNISGWFIAMGIFTRYLILKKYRGAKNA